MQSAKEEALEAIRKLPDSADVDDILYLLYVLGNVRCGKQDVHGGATESADHLLSDIKYW